MRGSPNRNPALTALIPRLAELSGAILFFFFPIDNCDRKKQINLTTAPDRETLKPGSIFFNTQNLPMAPLIASRKRKGPSEITAPDDELANIELDGVLSQSEDESGFEESEPEDVAEGDEDENEETDEDEDEDDEDAHSEDLPSEPGLEPSWNRSIDDEDDKLNYKIVKDANGGERYEYTEIDPVYDSDDSDAQGPVNTIGNIPLSFYDSYPHIGYDINGKKIMRPATGDALDALLDSIEIPKGWTGLTDPETGKPLALSQQELELLRRLQMNEVPEEGYDPYAVCLPSPA